MAGVNGLRAKIKGQQKRCMYERSVKKQFFNRLLIFGFCVTFFFFQILPSWKVNLSGSIALKFRTNERNGLLLYNGGGGGPEKVSVVQVLGITGMNANIVHGTGKSVPFSYLELCKNIFAPYCAAVPV